MGADIVAFLGEATSALDGVASMRITRAMDRVAATGGNSLQGILQSAWVSPSGTAASGG